jgi:hypothetical protein
MAEGLWKNGGVRCEESILLVGRRCDEFGRTRRSLGGLDLEDVRTEVCWEGFGRSRCEKPRLLKRFVVKVAAIVDSSLV